jgi:hypothetical protein
LGEHPAGHLGDHLTFCAWDSLSQGYVEQHCHRRFGCHSRGHPLGDASTGMELAESDPGDMARYFTIRAISQWSCDVE